MDAETEERLKEMMSPGPGRPTQRRTIPNELRVIAEICHKSELHRVAGTLLLIADELDSGEVVEGDGDG